MGIVWCNGDLRKNIYLVKAIWTKCFKWYYKYPLSGLKSTFWKGNLWYRQFHVIYANCSLKKGFVTKFLLMVRWLSHLSQYVVLILWILMRHWHIILWGINCGKCKCWQSGYRKTNVVNAYYTKSVAVKVQWSRWREVEFMLEDWQSGYRSC